MNPIIEYLTGMNVLTDQIIAMDLLISAKNGVRNYAMATTEAGTPEVKKSLSAIWKKHSICTNNSRAI